MNDKRNFSRIPFDAMGRFCNDQGCHESQLIDVSLKGALISRPAGWSGKIGDQWNLELLLDNGNLTITMEVAVAHLEADKIGCRCEHIELESISHLRRLVELNLGDEAILDRELHALIGNR